MKNLITILLLFFAGNVLAQSTIHLRGDTTKIYKQGGIATLRIENATRDSINGVLINIGNGITQFQRIRAINDSQFTVGTDTITIAGATGGGGGVVIVEDSLATLINANGGGYLVMDRRKVDTLELKNFAAGPFIDLDSTQTLITIKVDSAAMRTWIETFTFDGVGGGEADSSIFATRAWTYYLIDSLDAAGVILENAPVGDYTLLNDYTFSDVSYLKPLRDSIFWKVDSSAYRNTGYLDTAAMRTWILTFATGEGGGGGTPGGSDSHIQYNNGGSFGGEATLVYDDTNDRVGIGTPTPLHQLHIQYDGLGATDGDGNSDGIYLHNATAAAAGAQQRSPAIHFQGYGWRTTATAASQKSEGWLYMQPVQGTNNSWPSLVYQTQTADATIQNSMTLFSTGLQIVPGGGAGGLSFSAALPTANTITTTTGLTVINTSTSSANAYTFNNSTGFQQTSGTTKMFNISNGSSTTGFYPSSGTATHTVFSVAGNINQTGGANGITRGVYIETITQAAADWRPLQIDSGRAFISALVVDYVSAPSSASYTVVEDEYFIELQDLTTAAINRNIVLPAATEAGRVLIVTNLSSDATYKWSFSGATVNDATGASITTLDDQTNYKIISNGSIWRRVN
jgi:hypothetical protein